MKSVKDLRASMLIIIPAIVNTNPIIQKINTALAKLLVFLLQECPKLQTRIIIKPTIGIPVSSIIPINFHVGRGLSLLAIAGWLIGAAGC
jgi:hypothetical protein